MKLTKDILKTTEAYIAKLKRGGIETVQDLLGLFPKGLEDTSNVLSHFAYVNVKEKNTLLVTIANVKKERTKYNKTLVKIIVSDDAGQLSECVFFRSPWILNQVKNGQKIIIKGKPKYEYGKLSFPQPDIEPYSQDRQTLLPIYPDVQGVGAKWLAGKVPLLEPYIDHISEVLPEAIQEKKSFRPRKENVGALHFPSSVQDFERAKRELAYEELWIIQHEALSRKKTIQEESEGKSAGIPLDVEAMKSWISDLPYDLTNHQKVALFEVLKDMEQEHSMQRLLQGDVGTGKTIVAFLSALHALQHSNIQVAYMAPTAILASQVFQVASDFLGKYDIPCELLLGSMKAAEKKSTKGRLISGDTRCVIGTHALIQDDVEFADLGYVIIDEQHRFGVEQRRKLAESSGSHRVPHALMMTATPIPRTLSMTLYGDQDLSIIREYPKGRLPIITGVVDEHHRSEMYRFVQAQIDLGRQIYWISPLVEESEKLDHVSVAETSEKLRGVFPDVAIESLHGRMKADEKDAIMQRFKEGEIHILSSTSVVEVGVDNPNATIISIENAERFGLSQLHQFRGRVGRGKHQSYCYLLTERQFSKRLKAMEKTNDGFELSQIDLELRGPGEVYGVRQSGLPDLKLADMSDTEMIYEVRKDIEAYLGLADS